MIHKETNEFKQNGKPLLMSSYLDMDIVYLPTKRLGAVTDH